MPRSFPGPCTGFSLTSTSPLSARSSPATRRNNVDFPHPEGPSKTRNSPTSRPADEKASSISKLTFSSALTGSPFAAGNERLTPRTVIFDFLCSMFRRLQMGRRAGHRGTCISQGCSRLAPGEQAAFQKREQEPKQKRCNSNRNDAGVDSLEIEDLACGLNHVANALPCIHHLGEDDVGPANV